MQKSHLKVVNLRDIAGERKKKTKQQNKQNKAKKKSAQLGPNYTTELRLKYLFMSCTTPYHTSCEE